MAKILVVAESQGEILHRATLSAITMAREAATILGGGFDILVLGGPGSASVATTLAAYGAEHILLVEAVDLSAYLVEKFVSTATNVAHAYTLVLAGATRFGRDLLPRVAGHLDAVYAADCSGITNHDGTVSFERPMYASNVFGFVTLHTRVSVATARPCAFEAAVPVGGNTPIQGLPATRPSKATSRIELVSQTVAQNDRLSLTEAKTIVSGGRPLKQRFFEVLAPLASALGAAIGATRIACNAGYALGELQVGQSGTAVAPQLYFAIGISGAVQHIAGIRSARVIVAINRDPQAPIFQVADYGLVADLYEAVPEIVRRLSAR